MNSVPEDWARVEAAFEAALVATPENREAVLASIPDPAVREEVRSLLEAHRDAGDFLGSTAEREAAPFLEELPAGAGEEPGVLIGPYRLLEEIGHGGMGSVWSAERADGSFRQRVALKLVRRGLDTDEILARFLRERRILATLDHPGIARLLDGGATPDGRPYFVMEYVPGVPITTFCETQDVEPGRRLDLFVTVCRAVQHAHDRLVVHRDLKPSNVLVTEAGEVKLLDFGIAKLIEEDSYEGAGPPTRLGARLATPEYASPEQLAGESVTTRSDVYQLGLLLHEILTGRRATEPGRRDRLEGDLANIVKAAMHEEPERRYPSAVALGDDVLRYQGGFPVKARGDATAYRVGRFLRRKRGLVAAVGTVVVGGFGLGTAYTMRLQDERDRVRVEAEKANASAELLESFFLAWDPDAADPGRVTSRDILDVAAARARRAVTETPEVRASTLSLIGSLYTSLSSFETADSLLHEAERLQREGVGQARADLAATTERLGNLHLARGELPAAEARYRDALAMRRAIDGPVHDRTLGAHLNLASLLWTRERFDEAEDELRALLAPYAQGAHGDIPQPAIRAMRLLGVVLFFQGRLAESETVLADVLARQTRVFGPEDPDVVETSSMLAGVLRDLGRLEEADRLQDEALARLRARYGESHPRTLVAGFLKAMVLERQARHDEAVALMRGVVREGERVLGPEHFSTGAWSGMLGAVLLERGDTDEALAYLRRSLAVIERSADGSDEAGDLHYRIAWILARRSDPEATEAYGAARAFHAGRPAGDPDFVSDGLHYLAWTMRHMGDLDQAEAVYRRALELYRPALSSRHPSLLATVAGLGEVLVDQGRPTEAEPFLSEALGAWRPAGPWGAADLERVRAALDRVRAAGASGTSHRRGGAAGARPRPPLTASAPRPPPRRPAR